MPMISFSGETSQGPFWKQIQEGMKTQTVRRPRKRPICEGDTLHLYWKVRVPKDKKPIHLIHTAVCTRVRRLIYIEFAFDDAFAKRDGFRDHHELQEWFGNPFLTPGTEYVVIEWSVLYSVENLKEKLEKITQPALEIATVNQTGKCSTPQESLRHPSVPPTKLTLEERAQKLVDLEAELHLHETFWGAALYPTSSIIAEYDIVIALCEEILPDLPKHPEAMRKTIAKLKRRRNKYVKHREEEVTELMREKLDDAGLEHIEIAKVERIEEG